MKTCAIIGAGYRGLFMFGQRLVMKPYNELVSLVAVCDHNLTRAKYFSDTCGGLAVYTDFAKMLDEAKPDIVIVTTPDATHDRYIVQALDYGCDVISEKPMTTDPKKARLIQDAEKRAGKQVKVVFNMRYMPLQQRIKELILAGEIGEIYNVNLEWYLDRTHGADYFRRWHAEMANSGGLLIHKSTHHFDLINWWLGDTPADVHAYAALNLYGANREERGTNCRSCAYKDTCEFYWDIEESDIYKSMYADAEHEDGYVRDACVFRDEIDIYDTMHVQVKYQQGALLNYSLVAYSPYEGWHLSINGSRGRIEVKEYLSGSRMGEADNKIELTRVGEETETISVEKKEGSHGGGDDLLLMDMLQDEAGVTSVDDLGRKASSRDGVYSLIIGAAANESIRTNKSIDIESFLKQ